MMPAIILICMGLVLGIATDVFTRIPHQKSIKGKIVFLEPRKTHDRGRTTYTAHVEYYVNKRSYIVKSKFRSSTFRIGETIGVIYDEKNPTLAVVRPKHEVYLVMFVLILAGVIVGCNL